MHVMTMTQQRLFSDELLPPPKSFLKWAGGKSQLLSQFAPYYPKKFENYFEPFLGSGAVYWDLFTLKEKDEIDYNSAYLMDINDELINCYKIVQDDVENLIISLRKHKQCHNEEYFYETRAKLPSTLSALERASRFIYLNKTCFNGLYRVNSKGQFNVPMGKYANPNILNEKELRSASHALRNVTLNSENYDAIIEKAKKNDFVYFDPPYAPISSTSSFTSYTKTHFGYNEQVGLSEVFKKLDFMGCKLMLSNSWVDFTIDLYKNFNCFELKASRFINSNPAKRGKISELLVINYEL